MKHLTDVVTASTASRSGLEITRQSEAGNAISAFALRHRGVRWTEVSRALAHRLADAERRGTSATGTAVMDRNELNMPALAFDGAVRLEAAARYEAALARLRPEDREAVVARMELDRTYETLARTLGTQSADAARKAVSRALVRLAREMSRGE